MDKNGREEEKKYMKTVMNEQSTEIIVSNVRFFFFLFIRQTSQVFGSHLTQRYGKLCNFRMYGTHLSFRFWYRIEESSSFTKTLLSCGSKADTNQKKKAISFRSFDTEPWSSECYQLTPGEGDERVNKLAPSKKKNS
jgi:hypothetical protein